MARCEYDGRTCNARVFTGCKQKPVHVLAGSGARGIAVDEQTGTVYVANTSANTVSVIDGMTCNATVHRGCDAGPGRPSRHEPTPRRRRRANEHGLRHERVLELGDDVGRANL